MAKGNDSKKIILQKIMETFPGSFMQDDKILRIPMEEDGASVEIKVTLTAAKDLLGGGAVLDLSDSDAKKDAGTAASPLIAEPTDEEKKNVQLMMEKLGMI